MAWDVDHKCFACPHKQPAKLSEGDDVDYNTESDTASAVEGCRLSDYFYSADEINTFIRSVKVRDYFANIDEFIIYACLQQRTCGLDALDKKKLLLL